VFLGEYAHGLDNKGRLTIPSRFREELGSPCVVTRGLDQCLFVYPPQECPKSALIDPAAKVQTQRAALPSYEYRASRQFQLTGSEPYHNDLFFLHRSSRRRRLLYCHTGAYNTNTQPALT
jgi:hypothetical protein